MHTLLLANVTPPLSQTSDPVSGVSRGGGGFDSPRAALSKGRHSPKGGGKKVKFTVNDVQSQIHGQGLKKVIGQNGTNKMVRTKWYE